MDTTYIWFSLLGDCIRFQMLSKDTVAFTRLLFKGVG